MQTTKQLNELFDTIVPSHPNYSAEEKAAARELHSFAKDWAVMTCLLVARRMLDAAKHAEMTPYFQNAPKHYSINPGSPTDFVLY